MKLTYNKINPQYEINKRMIQDTKQALTTKIEDQKQYKRLEPLIPVQLAKNLILSNDLLFTCIETLAQDIILNNLQITDTQNNPLPELLDFWDNNTLHEIYLAVQDRIGYGYGALEIIRDENNNPVKLKQVSAETLDIEVTHTYINNIEITSYYARYNNGTEHERMRLSRFDYTPEDDELTELIWLGGGRVSDFYDIPCWLPAFNKISADALLDELNAKKINEGNLISGILTVVSPPMTEHKIDEETGELKEISGSEQINNRLKEQIDQAGTGWMVLHLEQLTADLPLNVEYIPITEQNYGYLRELAEDCDESILRLFKIPKVRLMIDDVKESMNSNKTDSIWEIYTKELTSLQFIYEGEITRFNLKYFEVETLVDLELPIFSDRKQIEIQNTIQLFNIGLLTLNQALELLQKYYPDIDLPPVTNGLGDERYYNGNLLGFTNNKTLPSTADEEITGYEALHDFFNI